MMFKIKSIFRRRGGDGEVGDTLQKISFRDIPSTLDEAAKIPYLNSYISGLGSMPNYMSDLSFRFKGMTDVNIMYPLSPEIFAHVIVDHGSRRYNIIEPPRPRNELLERIEVEVAKMIGYIDVKDEEVGKILNEVVGKVIKKMGIKGLDAYYLKYHFLRDKVGIGFIEPFLRDKWIEDVAYTGAGNIYIYHKLFERMETNVEVDSEWVDRYLISLAERFGRKLSHNNPIIDIYLPDGSRFNVVYGSDISLKGSNFTIRKFPEIPYGIPDLVNFGTMDPIIAAYLWMMVESGSTIFFCGETASGKTTTLTAAIGMIPIDKRIVSIEEAPEIYVPHPNWVREVVRLHGGAKVTMFDLVKASLRQRPDYIIVGEIRGEEGKILMQAIETGHPAMSTMHAPNIKSFIQRLTSHPIDIPKTHIDNINIVVFQMKIQTLRGEARRVVEIDEIINYDADKDKVNFLPVFFYDFNAHRHRFSGSSFYLEERYAKIMELPSSKESYEILRERADFILDLSNRGVDYFEFINQLRRYSGR